MNANNPVAWRVKDRHGLDLYVTDLRAAEFYSVHGTPVPLYAAPQRMTVSREALLEAFTIYADPQMVRVTYSVEKLRALGIEVKE